MGLPEGWVTNPECSLTDAQQLTALGNGVLPGQATAALRTLIPVQAADDRRSPAGRESASA